MADHSSSSAAAATTTSSSSNLLSVMSDAVAGSHHPHRLRPRPASFACDTVVLRADKDGDDPESSQSRMRPLFQQQASTRTEVGRLFSARSPSPSSSRQASFNTQDMYSMSYTRNLLTDDRPDVSSHLYHRGLLEGRHSDITIIAFGTRYALHKLVLDRAPFFGSALSPPWLESSSKEITLHPEDTDANITKRAFEVALKRIYGSAEPVEAAGDPFALLATGSWLEMQDLIDDSVEAILASLNTANLAHALEILNESFYGEAGNKILAAAKFMLNREGHDLPADYWDELPADTIREVIGNDGFFAYSEWDRWALSKDILDRKLKTVADELDFPRKDGKLCKAPRSLRKFRGRLGAPNSGAEDSDVEELRKDHQKWFTLYSHSEIKPLLALLDNDIYYIHLDFEQLQLIRGAKDCFGLLVVPEKHINDALWCSMELRQKILNSKSTDVALGLTATGEIEHPSTFLSMQASPTISAQDATSAGTTPQHSRHTSTEIKRSSLRYRIPSCDCNIATGTAKLSTRFTRTVLNDGRAVHQSTRAEGSSRPLYYAGMQSPDGRSTQLYSTLPPFRFAVEFDRLHGLKNHRRQSSRTVFYAGSLWNLYIQRLPASSRSKPPRLGFYLHRVKDASELGRLNSVNDHISTLERGMRNPRDQPVPWPDYPSRVYGDSDADDATSNVRAAMHTLMRQPGSSRRSDLPQISALPFEDANEMFTSPTSSRAAAQVQAHAHAQAFHHHQQQQRHHNFDIGEPSSNGIGGGSKPVLPGASSNFLGSSISPHSRTPTLPPYTDVRTEVHAYFKVFVFSPDGRCSNCYQSAIAPFERAQSWGWRSSTLLAEGDWKDETNDDVLRYAGVGGADTSRGGMMTTPGGIPMGLEVDIEAGGDTDREGLVGLVGNDGGDGFAIVGGGGGGNGGPNSPSTAPGSAAIGGSGGMLRFMVVLGVV